MATDIKFEGLEEILEVLDSAMDARELKMAMGKACALVERSAKEKAPKGTGELRRSITSKVEADNTEVTGVVYTPLEYAPYVEYGTGLFAENGGRTDVPWNYKDDEGNWHSTSGQHPHPFMRPALDENREQVQRILKEGVTND
jgi:HK97 gp10 family phage protein